MSSISINASTTKTFEIGIVMAGAISAGPYTAGVMDYLLQVLNEWEEDKAKGIAPPHQVKLKVLTGASAGGMTAAITAAALCGEITPVTEPGTGENNPLYKSWVKDVDIEHLLKTNDLRPNQPIRSLLDATILEEIASSAIDMKSTNRPRSYLPDLLHIIMTVTNLRGIPYEFPFTDSPNLSHGMSLHADFMHFTLSDDGASQASGAIGLDRNRADRLKPHWSLLEKAAMATGAFPVGLAPRELERKFINQGDSFWDEYTKRGGVGSKDPSWPKGLTEEITKKSFYNYKFLCVDGGAINNEPIELAREILDMDKHLAEPEVSNPEQVTRSLLLIDPFPDPAPFDIEYQSEFGVPNVLATLFNAYKNQARFKPKELLQALDPQVASRFLIAPSGSKSPEPKYQLASSLLGGFGGLLSEDFRNHDFFLGRWNCHDFLSKYFVLPETHTLFSNWGQEDRDFYLQPNGMGGKPCLPIIPLRKKRRQVAKDLDWPRYSQRQFDKLREQVLVRMNGLAKQAVTTTFNTNTRSRLVGGLVRLAWLVERRRLLSWVMDKVERDLRMHKLM
jgi:hypothetical protein